MERTKEEFKKQMSKIFMRGILLAIAFLMTGVGSAFGETICLTNCKGDFDNDSDVDGFDLAVFSADFGRTDCLDIEKVVTVTSPNGGETIVKGYQDYTIWWNVNSTLSSNPDNEVKITYCPTFGSNQSCQIIIETTKSQNESYGYYSWSVPASLENGTYKIAVTSLGYGTNLSDMSDADFNVVSLDITPSITVTSPNGGESFKKGLSYNISWESEGTIPNFGISLQDSNNLGRSIVSIDGDNSVNSHTYSWLVDEDLPSGQYKLRVSGTDYSNATDISDNYFSIVDSSTSSSITITSPNSEEEWEIGKQHLIKWNTTGDINQVTVALNKSGVYVKNLIWNINNLGSISWAPDLSLESGDDYKIRITDPDNGVYDESDDYFSITKSSEFICLPDNTLLKLLDE